MSTSKPLYVSKPLCVYLQRPDTVEWVTVGRYILLNSDLRTMMDKRLQRSLKRLGA